MKKTLLNPNLILFLALLYAHINASAQWTKTSGPPGINVNTLYHSGNILYAGTSAKGVLKSGDDGLTWSAANSGIRNKNVFSLIADDSYLFAGTNEGVYRSSNGGNTWSPANINISNKFVVSFFNVNGFLFAGTVGGLFKSNDHGDTWTDASGGALGSSTIHAITFSDSNLVVVADNLIFYSFDNGDSWYYPTTSPFILIGNAAFITHGDSILVSAGTNVFRSFDAGQTWGHLIHISDSISISGLVESGGNIYAGTALGMYQSKNFGKKWTRISATGLRIGTRFFNHFAKSGKNFLLAFDEIGIAYTTDKGLNWNYSINGFTPASSIDNALIYSNNILYTGTHSDGVYESLNNGASWSKIGTMNNADSLSNANVYAMLKPGNNIILAGACGYGLYRSADNGVTWSHITSGLPQQAGTGFLCIQGLAKCSGNILAATDMGLFYSSDNGLNWHATNITGDDIAVAGVASNDSVACAAVNVFTGFSKIYKSTNKGKSWTPVLEVIDDFTTMATDGKNYFYAGSFTTGYVSSNYGGSWNFFGPGVITGAAFAIAVKDNNVWVGNSKGVYFSNNNASGFNNANTGLDPDPNRAVQGFALSSTDIFAGTFINSVWKRPLSDFGIAVASNMLNTKIRDEAHISMTPNPVKEEGMIAYNISQASPVVINLFDVSGRNIKTLVNARQDAGNHMVKFSTSNLSAGNYFAVVVIGNNHSTIKFSVIK